jgi:hypothetical protein
MSPRRRRNSERHRWPPPRRGMSSIHRSRRRALGCTGTSGLFHSCRTTHPRRSIRCRNTRPSCIACKRCRDHRGARWTHRRHRRPSRHQCPRFPLFHRRHPFHRRSRRSHRPLHPSHCRRFHHHDRPYCFHRSRSHHRVRPRRARRHQSCHPWRGHLRHRCCCRRYRAPRLVLWRWIRPCPHHSCRSRNRTRS